MRTFYHPAAVALTTRRRATRLNLRWIRSLASVATSVTLLVSCREPLTVICALPGFSGVAVQLETVFGRPAAFGAKLVVHDGAYVDSSFGYSDPRSIGAAENRAGTYTLEITRPWYQPVVMSDVHVPGDRCGAYRTVTVSSTLHLLPGAPAVRNAVVVPHGAGLGLAGLEIQYAAYVDANPGVDTTVTWSVSDTTVARITPSGRLVSQCRTYWGEATVLATSTVDTTVKGEGKLTVYANAQSCP